MRVAIQLLHENARLPVYASEQAAGADIFSCLEQELVLQPLARALVPTGLALELPEGYEAQVRPRSGLAFKHGIALVNAPGTIDADYRGELRILLINLGSEAVTIRHGDRIAQLVIAPVLQATFESVQSLSPTERASGGFGSTGR